MKIEIKFSCDSAAFVDDFCGSLYDALEQCYLKIIAQRGREPGCICTAPESIDLVIDKNGNSVGTIKVLED